MIGCERKSGRSSAVSKHEIRSQVGRHSRLVPVPFHQQLSAEVGSHRFLVCNDKTRQQSATGSARTINTPICCASLLHRTINNVNPSYSIGRLKLRSTTPNEYHQYYQDLLVSGEDALAITCHYCFGDHAGIHRTEWLATRACLWSTVLSF